MNKVNQSSPKLLARANNAGKLDKEQKQEKSLDLFHSPQKINNDQQPQTKKPLSPQQVKINDTKLESSLKVRRDEFLNSINQNPSMENYQLICKAIDSYWNNPNDDVNQLSDQAKEKERKAIKTFKIELMNVLTSAKSVR